MVKRTAQDFMRAEHLLAVANHAITLLRGRFDAESETPLPPETFAEIQVAMQDLGDHARQLAAKQSADSTRRLIKALGEPIAFKSVLSAFESVEAAFEEEMSSWETVILVPSQSALLHDGVGMILGFEALAKFPDLQFDLDAACRCQAFGESSAVMYHLMRVTERVIHYWANSHGIKRTRFRDTRGEIRDIPWKEIAHEFSGVIHAMPNDTQEGRHDREIQLRAVRLLSSFAAAWQSKTPYPAKEYTVVQSDHALHLTIDLLRMVAQFLQPVSLSIAA